MTFGNIVQMSNTTRKISEVLCGTHEMQVSEVGEADLHKHYNSCEKNSGHKQFLPVNDYNIYLLLEVDDNNDLVEYINIIADLTVRVAVTMTSIERPEFWPKTKQKYPFYETRLSDVMRVGTGTMNYVNIEYHMGKCSCNNCKHSNTPNSVWGEVWMYIATHVVFDEEEARHTTCRLFYDAQYSPLVTLNGWVMVDANIEKDRCWLKCLTCDVDLLDKLDKIKKRWYNLWGKVTKKYERSGGNLTWIISHPHGCAKQISVGHWIDIYDVGDYSTKYTYTTCTCPGSSGAYVHLLGYDVGWLYGRHVHSGVNSEGRNFSSAGRNIM